MHKSCLGPGFHSRESMIDRRKIGNFVLKGGLAILDQGLATGVNFVVSIVLARYLSSEEYGAYALGFAVLLLLGLLYQALLLEPMGVFGASAYRKSFRSYLTTIVSLHVSISLGIVVLVGAAAGIELKVTGQPTLAGALFGVAVAAPPILLFWMVKRAYYVQFAPGPSAVGAASYCVLTLGVLAFAYVHHRLSPFIAFLSMGLGALGAGIALLWYFLHGLPPDTDSTTFTEIWQRHWRYGRWAVASSALAWVPLNIFYPVVSTFSGMSQAGELRALANFSSPIGQAVAALSTLLLPFASRTQERHGSAGGRTLSRWVGLLFISAAVLYWSVFLGFREPVFRILYSGKYMEVAYLLPAIALGSIFWSGFVGPANALRAMESPASVFVAVCCASVVAVAVGIPATWHWGLKGAVWSMAAAQGLGFVAAVILLRRRLRHPSALGPSGDLETMPPIPTDSVS
jgi:O-antigen/teichoic acid export membrane protein